MSYASQTDLETSFGTSELVQLTDRADPPVGTANADVIAQALADADATVDSYLGTRYAVPLASTPDSVRSAACQIARFLLWKDHAPEEVRRRYDDAMRWLREVSACRALLPDTTLAGESAATGTRARGHRVVTVTGAGVVIGARPVFSDVLLNRIPSAWNSGGKDPRIGRDPYVDD